LGKPSFRRILSAETINKVTLQMPLQTTKLTFPDAYLVVGDVNTKEVKKLVTKLLALGPKESLRRSHILILKMCNTQIDFVDMPNAVQSEISVVNTINLKLPTNNILLLS
jgi:hypothetical protein